MKFRGMRIQCSYNHPNCMFRVLEAYRALKLQVVYGSDPRAGKRMGMGLAVSALGCLAFVVGRRAVRKVAWTVETWGQKAN